MLKYIWYFARLFVPLQYATKEESNSNRSIVWYWTGGRQASDSARLDGRCCCTTCGTAAGLWRKCCRTDRRDFHYPMMLQPEKVAKEIVYAINHKKHIRVIDWKYRVLTAFWRRIPRWLWRRFKLK